MASSASSGLEPTRVGHRDLRFTRLAFENWRNFRKVNVSLQPRMFLVGPNAAGKSNLLDTFRFLFDLVTVGGGFHYAVNRRGGVSMIRSLAARRYPAVTVDVALGTDQEPEEWRYRLKFIQDNQRRPKIEEEVIERRGEVLLSRPDAEDRADSERLRQTYLEQVNVNRTFRDIADFFATVRYMHVVPQLVREPDRSVGRSGDPFGGDFLEQIARTDKRTRESRLKRIRNALRVAVPQLQDLRLQRDLRGTPHLEGNYQHWRPHGHWQSEEQFSDGTLRLLGLLWAVMDGTGPLLLEEPELSLHPEVVRQIPQMFGQVQRRSGRQIVVSSHSPEILDDSGIGLDEVLALRPVAEGTEAWLLIDEPDAVAMHENGVGVGEIVSALTAPEEAPELATFGG